MRPGTAYRPATRQTQDDAARHDLPAPQPSLRSGFQTLYLSSSCLSVFGLFERQASLSLAGDRQNLAARSGFEPVSPDSESGVRTNWTIGQQKGLKSVVVRLGFEPRPRPL